MKKQGWLRASAKAFVVGAMAGITACKGPAVVELEQGSIRGNVNLLDKVVVWKGVPYAEPPVGDMRWRAPQPVESWDGALDTRQYSKACMQLGSMYGPEPDGYSQTESLNETFDLPVGSEDCLYLNVWRPLKKHREPLPVIVFIHGGSHVYGAGSLYNGKEVAKKGAVYVSINYRLGLMGWLQHPALKSESGDDPLNDSGNFATLDIIESLKFIKQNAVAFGGDPDNITIVGQSAGGGSVFSLLVSPLAENLFHKAVMMSPALLNQPLEVGEQYANGLLMTLVIGAGLAQDPESAASFLAAQDAAWVREFLYSLTAEQLYGAVAKVPDLRVAPAVFTDGTVQPLDPIANIQSGQFNNVPMMVGMTGEEGKLFTQSLWALENAEMWSAIVQFEPALADPLTLEDMLVPEAFPVDRPQVGECGAEGFVPGGYNVFAESCGALAPTAFFRQVQDAMLPLLASQQPDLFAYTWNWNQQPEPLKTFHGAVHGGDIPFLIGNFDNALFETGYTHENQPGRKALSRYMLNSLLAFANNSDPNAPTADIAWLPWSPFEGQPKRLVLDADSEQAQISMQY